MLKKCFGIPSWLPSAEPARTQRQARLNRLFEQLSTLWPDVDILIIAQNWQDFKPNPIKNKLIIKNYDALGILKARKTLHDEFIKLDYDYIIMFDDDAVIQCDNEHAHLDFMAEIDKYPNGFCFIHGENSPYHPYVAAQLNLCAISKYIYEKEQMVDIDPQKNEGFEDSIYSCLLHHKYAQYEFLPPATIRTTQFGNNSDAPSTWWGQEANRPMNLMVNNTHRIERYIVEHKDFPINYKNMIVYKEKPITQLADGKVGTYLYF